MRVFDPNPVRLETAPTGLEYIAGVKNSSKKSKTEKPCYLFPNLTDAD